MIGCGRSIHDYFIKAWYAKKLTWPMRLLLPVSYLFLMIVGLRRWLYRRGLLKSYSIAAPVIVIGNITVGGTGKTPCIIALARHFTVQGYRVGVISRGYGAKITEPMLVTVNSDPAQVGDEPVIIARNTQCAVMVSPNRVQSAKILQKDYGCNLILSDDGLQHYALQRNIEIVLQLADREFGNECMLPAGPLREPITRINQADYVLLNGGDGDASRYAMTVKPIGFFKVNDFSPYCDVSALKQQPVHAVTGIGHPAGFFTLLRTMGLTIIEHAYPDHHPFKLQDIQFNDNFPVVMTEKDAIKCSGLDDGRGIFLAVQAEFSAGFLDELNRVLKRM